MHSFLLLASLFKRASEPYEFAVAGILFVFHQSQDLVPRSSHSLSWPPFWINFHPPWTNWSRDFCCVPGSSPDDPPFWKSSRRRPWGRGVEEPSARLSISYLESSFLTAHGLTKRTTLERSVRGAVLIGCSKTMQMTGSKSEIQYGGPNSTKNCLQAWTVNVCKCYHNIAFESKHPVDLYWPKVTKESILLLL